MIAGIQVPSVATSEELRLFVHSVYVALDENCLATGNAIGVSAATIWKLEEGEQKDSQVVRDALSIRRTPVRPRVWMPTNNVSAAAEQMLAHYTTGEIMNALVEAGAEIDSWSYHLPLPEGGGHFPGGPADATPLSASVNWIP
jgi:hypothetical protein